MTKLKNANFDKTKKNQAVTKLQKNTNCDKTTKFKLRRNWKSQVVTKLKNSNCYNSKTQIITKLKNSNCDKTLKLKFWKKNSKAQIVTKL